MGVPLCLLIQEKYGVFNHTVSCHSLVLNGHVSANIICSDSNVVTFPGKYAATIWIPSLTLRCSFSSQIASATETM